MSFLGIDTGGTFTDFVLWHDGRLRVHKVLSTPQAPEQAILQGIREMGVDTHGLQVIHGSTVATNAVLEGKGVRTVFVTNHGFADLLSIGRQNRRALYTLQPAAVAPPVPRALCLETGGRLGADGRVLEPLDEADLIRLRAAIVALAPRAVAVNLLFAYLDPGLEQRIAAALPPGLFVSLSSRVLPEIKEYERGMATWLNAWVGPLVEGYLGRLRTGLPGARVAVMQSCGQTVAADQAGAQAVRMLLSGPAAGLVAAHHVASAAGCEHLLTFDMGGTSTDVALIQGEPRLTTEGRIGDYPVAVPMVDMHTIGAGGGSIAWLDAGGMLQVGPQSAGAEPGPACYGRGGVSATVTDANLVLGRLQADAFLGGAMCLDTAAARRALAALAQRLDCGVEQAALDVVAVANEHMARALRTISVGRGEDPRGHTLVSFGGAGGLHVCALAEALDMQAALVPAFGGVLSALGMLVARPGRQLSQTSIALLDECSEREIQAVLDRLAGEGEAALAEEGVDASSCTRAASLDLRYRGQAYTLNVAWRGLASCIASFHDLHEQRYGHRLDLPVEMVTSRMQIQGPAPQVELATLGPRPAVQDAAYCSAVGCLAPVPVVRRVDLAAGQVVVGPAVLVEQVATTWVAGGWRGVVDRVGNLRLTRD